MFLYVYVFNHIWTCTTLTLLANAFLFWKKCYVKLPMVSFIIKDSFNMQDAIRKLVSITIIIIWEESNIFN